MAAILSLATQETEWTLSAADTKAFLSSILPPRDADRFQRHVELSRIQQRHAVAPYDELRRLDTLEARSTLYMKHALSIGERAALRALCNAGLEPHDVDLLIVASSTGYTVPTLDQHFASRLGLRSDARSLFLTGLGCAGAVRGIGLAGDLLRADAARPCALVIGVELCSPWLQVAEPSPQDVISNIVFGDGAAAAVIVATSSAKLATVIAHHAEIWPQSLGARGAKLTESGFRHVTSPTLSRVVRAHLPQTVMDFLSKQGASTADLRFYMVNPSDHSVAETVASVLDIPNHLMRPTWATWERHGNTLSAGPLYVLDALRHLASPMNGDVGLAVTLGPGVTCDLMLLRWHGGPLAGDRLHPGFTRSLQ